VVYIDTFFSCMVVRDVPDSGWPVLPAGNCVTVSTGIKGDDSDILQTAAIDRPRPVATQAASLCTYISA